MLRNYLTIGLRVIWKDKGHTAINVVGLCLGLGCCILIALFVKDEWTYDKFHKHADNIYRAYVMENWGENEEFFNTTTPFPLGPTLKGNFSEVQFEVRIIPNSTSIKIGDQQYSENITIVGQDFFEVFSFHTISGDPTRALQSQKSVILTQTKATRYFGTQDPLGQVVSMRLGDNFEEFEVQSIIEDAPSNSSLQFNILISELNLPKVYSHQVLTSAWFNVLPETYLRLQSGTDHDVLAEKFPELVRTVIGEEDFQNSQYRIGLQPLAAIHLDTSYPVGLAPVNDPRQSYILIAVALLVLLVACINYVTLAVGRSMKRTKEVGIRKIVGAGRKQLMGQFISESVIITSISLMLGLVLAKITLPTFNDLAGKQLSMDLNYSLVLLLALMALLIGLAAGSYPAYILSRFKPIEIVRGTTKGLSNHRIRTLLVGVQIFISVFLISSTLFMKQQLNLLHYKDLGFNKEQLAIVPLNVSSPGGFSDLMTAGFAKAAQMKTELAKLPNVLASSTASHDFGNGDWGLLGYTDDQGLYRSFYMNIIDEDYLSTLKIDIAKGRGFSQENPGDYSQSILVNEAFTQSYGWDNPIGKSIPGKNFKSHEIVGVVKNFNYAALYNKVEPLVLLMDPTILLGGVENVEFDNAPVPRLIIRLNHSGSSETMQQVKSVWERIVTEGSFNYSYVKQTLAAQYRSDENLGQIINILTWLSILIGGLGLYALASLTMQNRQKEISIRRVLGASGSTLLVLLSKDYVILVLTAFLISVPFTWYLLGIWLANFEYKIPLSIDKFLIAGALALAIAFVSISYRALRTALANPVDTLKNE